MTDITNPLIEALRPLTSRVRTDVTAIRVEDGTSRWTDSPLTDDAMARHLNGGPGRGVCPILEGEDVTMVGLLDFDSHKGEIPWPEMCLTVGMVAEALQLAYGMEPIVFRSSGGRGLHLYCLWDFPQDAYSVRRMLADTLKAVGLKSGAKGLIHKQVEIFPKQNEVARGKYGNQFILPFAGRSELLEYDDLSGGYISCGRVAPTWKFSSAVTVVEKPVKPAAAAMVASTAPGGEAPLWRQALDALTNRGDDELDYEDWFTVVSAIHHETQGSAEGYAIAMAWSARSAKHDAEFFENRVWPYLGRDGARANGGGSIKSLATRHHNWHEPIIPLGAIPDPDEGTDPEADRRLMPRRHDLDRAAEVARDALRPIERRGVPPSKHLTTDLANANRIVAAYGASILVVGEKWYVWTGKVWRMDEGEAYRIACKLSSIIRQEMKDLERRAAETGMLGEGGKAKELIAALAKWSSKSEMKGAIEAALGLARKMLTVDAAVLNSHRGLLNCRNGVVDLRTGQLLAHDPTYFMTHLADVDYKPNADQTEWHRTLVQITREEHEASMDWGTPVADFLQRWFGYCATGEVNEQAFVVHWGDGANGKSTLLGTVSKVLGSYAGVAPPGLITNVGKKGTDHPTGLASLMGLRMAVAHESGEGATLTDDVVKHITGDDRIAARFMAKDFFYFDPTHKIQLLTNHRPAIKGTDHGIWRRVCLVPYKAVFGSPEEVAAGRATAVKDKTLTQRLAAPAALEGVLAWMVAGAVAWYERGLDAPEAVLEASKGYRESQDRVAQFVDECCEAGAEYEEPMMIGPLGLYPAYSAWCKEAGVFALARGRFVSELERTLPGLTFKDVYQRTAGKTRRKVRMAMGVRLLE